MTNPDRLKGIDRVAVRDARLDQIAAQVRQQREAGGPHVQLLVDVEQALLTDVLANFPDLDLTTLGGLLLHLGGRMSSVADRLPEQIKPHTAAMFVNLLQLVGERLWHRQPPVVWPCPYRYEGGAPCKAELTAPTDDELESKIAGHLALHHPNNRRERRA